MKKKNNKTTKVGWYYRIFTLTPTHNEFDGRTRYGRGNNTLEVIFMNSDNQKVIIVGGGLAGLAASVFLARAGFKVTIYEKSSHVGGRGITNTFDGNIHFNLGAHAVYPIAEKIIRELGIPFSGGHPSVDNILIYHDKFYTSPTTPTSLLKTKLLGVGAKIELAGLITKVTRLDTTKLQTVTVRDWLDQNVKNEAVKGFLETMLRVATYANAPEQLSAGFAIATLQNVIKGGVRYLDGGWQTLIDGLVVAAKTADVEIITSAAVTSVAKDGTVTLANGTADKAQAVLICAEPQLASQLIENGNQPQLKKWADNAVPVRASVYDLALSRLPKPERTVVFDVQKSLYYSVHSKVAKLAPEGVVVIHTAKYLKPGQAPIDKSELETLLDVLQPGWRDLVIKSRFLPEMVVSNKLVTAKEGGIAGRATVNLPGYSKIFLAGDWVGTEGNLAEAVFSSAKQASAQIIRQFANQPNLASVA
jgi:phytoene dehydrogenase-like protein